MKHLSCAFFSLFLAASASAQASRVVYWDPAQGGNGHWYGIYEMPTDIDWHTARGEAQAMGGDLASLSTQTEHDFVRPLASDPAFWVSYTHGNYGPWIGLAQDPQGAEPGGGWAWLDGSSLSFTNWLPGAPDQWFGFEEDYAQFKSLVGYDLTWNDLRDTGGYQEPLIASYLAEFAGPAIQARNFSRPLEYQVFGKWAAPSAPVWLAVARVWTPDAGPDVPGCPGLRADIFGVQESRQKRTQADGSFDFFLRLPPQASGQTLYLQSFDLIGCRKSNVEVLQVP